jgi:hypothetical protein
LDILSIKLANYALASWDVVIGEGKSMRFICFSSGSQRRYRDDVIRAMAMPAGCELTFRYRLKYLALAVQESLKAKRIGRDDQILICYLDQSDRQKPVDFIPVRFATLIEAPTIGDFVVLRMQVQNFAFTADLDAFNREVHSRSAEVPKWPKDPTEPYASGAFWVEINDYPKSVVESTAISDWQITVNHLLKRADFSSSGPFYQVVRIQEVKNQSTIAMSNGQYTLKPETEYELLIDHFLPTESNKAFQLETALSGGGLTFITGSTMQIDSPYDRHWLRFKTLGPLKDERAVITVNKKTSGEDAAMQFDLPISIKGRIYKAVWIGIFVGLLLATPQFITSWISPAFANKSPAWFFGLFAFIAALNVAAGITATLNFRKPIS